MAASVIIKHLHDGSLTVKDGTGTPVSLTVPFSVGDFTLTGVQEQQNAVIAYETRGDLHVVRHTTRTYPTGSFSVMLADYSDATNQTLRDFLLRQNAYSANIGTLTPDEVYAVDLVWTVEGTDLGDPADHVATMTDCVCTLDFAEGEPNTLSVSFTMYGTYTQT